ncbi:transposase [Candidatus Latescibacterota bacterium]
MSADKWTYNLGNFIRRLVLPGKIKHYSLRSLLTKRIKIGAKVVRHSRYVTFQIAEVAIKKKLFAEISVLIERLLYYSF